MAYGRSSKLIADSYNRCAMSEPYTVLVVDDEEVLRLGCSRVLASEGYRVNTAANGREALDLLAAEPANVILCDLKMPVMGALELLEEASVRFPNIPVIIMTGLGTVADAVECMKKGAYDFVTKPFSIDHLTVVVRRALEMQLLEARTRQLQEEQARNLYNLAMEQSRMHTIVNCMADGVLVTNREGEVVLCNSTLLQLLGVETPPPNPGRCTTTWTTPILSAPSPPCWRKAIRTAANSWFRSSPPTACTCGPCRRPSTARTTRCWARSRYFTTSPTSKKWTK